MKASPSVCAVIPARGGSKGIKLKNTQEVGGIPLVVRSVQAASSSRSIESVFVTTDNNRIQSLAESAGASVIIRPAELSSDLASSESALLHALDYLESHNKLPSVLVFLQCTSPFTTPDQIDLVVEPVLRGVSQSSFSVVPWHGFLWRLNGVGINHDPSLPRQRRQDLEPSFMETGAIYVMNVRSFRQSRNRFCMPAMPVVIDAPGVEIDTEADLQICNLIHDSKFSGMSD